MHDTGGEIEAQSLSLRPWLQAAIVCLLAAGAGGVFWYGQSHKLDAAEVVKTRAAFTPAAGNSFVLTPAQLATVTTETVKPRRFHEEITTEGKIGVDEYQATPIFSPYPGRVIAIFARTGEHVEHGERLFSVQANEMVQAQNDFLAALNVLNKSRSQLSFAQSVEKRLRDLFETKITTLRELQVAQNDLSTATNDLRTAEVGLEAVRNRLRILGLKDVEMTALQQKGAINPETVINAPLNGTVIQRKIGPGQYVGTGGEPSYIIGNLSRVWLIAQLREPDAAKVALGERLQFRVLAHPDRLFEGTISFIASSVDPTSRRIVVRAEIQNPAGLLKPEMYASVKIINDHETLSQSVPRAAVIYEGDKASVWVLRADNSVENRRIKPGILNGDILEVLDGLRPGERVIAKGALFIDRAATQG